MSSIIVLDSSDEELDNPKPRPPRTLLTTSSNKSNSCLPNNEIITLNSPTLLNKPPADDGSRGRNEQTKNKDESYSKRSNCSLTTAAAINYIPKKRLKPIQLSTTVNKNKYENSENIILFPQSKEMELIKPIINANCEEQLSINENTLIKPHTQSNDTITPISNRQISYNDNDKNLDLSRPLDSTYKALIDACRIADPSDDMDKLIRTKLIKYYYSVHPDFIKSKKFVKTVLQVTNEIQDTPELVYYKVKTIVEELKVRKKSKVIVMSNEDVTSTGSKKRDDQIKKLNKALFVLTKRIAKCEELDVDLNDDANSSYLQVERFKKRACQIYEKICDLTGESKHAHRLVKKPISFNGTSFPLFNKTIQSYLNRTKEFPDYFDVLKVLEHCNHRHEFGLRTDQVKTLALDAFNKIGKLLQDRRKTDLYETVAHFTSNSSDPALSDGTLSEKLNENQKHHTKISSIIEKYAKEQEKTTDEPELENKDLKEDSFEGCNNNNDKNELVRDNAQDEMLKISTNVKLYDRSNNNQKCVNANKKSCEIPPSYLDKSSPQNVKFIQIYSVASLNKTNNNEHDLKTHLKQADEIIISDDEL